MGCNSSRRCQALMKAVLLVVWGFSWLPVRTAGGAFLPEVERFVQKGGARRVLLDSNSTEAESLLQFRRGVLGDPNDVLESWDTERNPDICSWRGVTCDVGRVSTLNLAGQNLTGEISPSLGNLTLLTSLVLSNNGFAGTVPTSLGSLTRLRRLDLSNNALERGIPSEISNSSSLTILRLSNNPLSGTIPPELGRLRNLTELDLRNIGLSSSIPNSLGNCSSLEVLRLGGNGLQGQTPAIFDSLQLLKVLDLSNNWYLDWTIPPVMLFLNCSSLAFLNLSKAGLTGSISPELSNLPSIASIDFSQNNLTHSIPESLSNRSTLLRLDFSTNSLTGEIPYELGRLERLEYLDVSYNQLSGVFPPQIFNCSYLNYLSIVTNNLTGIVPEYIGDLRKLQYLDLSYNKLTGSIPSSLVNCTALHHLDLYHNNLTGEILQDIGLLRNLTRLRLDFNKLRGHIPASLGNLSSLVYLALGGNPLAIPSPSPLTGPIPEEIANLQNLKTFYLSSTLVSGGIPPWIGRMSGLSRLFMFGNVLLGGTIPPEIGNLTNLITLVMGGNRHFGQIPSTVGRLSNLGLLGFHYNSRLTGPIPSELGNLTRIVQIDLQDNSFTGQLIPEVGQLSSIQNLSLDSNNLTGPLPASLKNCSQLVRFSLSNNKLSGPILREVWVRIRSHIFDIDLSRNELSGTIPPEIGLWENIGLLNLSFNRFTESIPSEIQECRVLTSLDLSNNRLTGELPVIALQRLPYLQNFSVANNSLEGSIPDGVGPFANVTAEAYAGNPDLCGALLGRNCSVGQTCHGTGCQRTRIYIAVGIAAFILVALIVLGLICAERTSRCCWRGKETVSPEGEDVFGIPYLSVFTKDLNLTIEDLWTATEGFSDHNIIGAGGHSTVFKAVLPARFNLVIAVKCLTLEPKDTNLVTHGLYRELRFLGNLRHRNLVKLHGFCATPSMKAMLMELVPNGSLHSHLHPCAGDHRSACMLSFDTRFGIAIGVADAVAYLHHECGRPVIHRDLKPSNILLDTDFTAKVADFGIAKHVRVHDGCSNGIDGEATVTGLRGTTGYIAPEYAMSNKVSTKGDVYSYGVILLEMLTGRRPTDEAFGKDGTWLREWVQQSVSSDDRLVSILDHTLQSEFAANEKRIHMMVSVGLLCTRETPRERPSMKDVRQMLAQVKDAASHGAEGAANLRRPTVQELALMPNFSTSGSWI